MKTRTRFSLQLGPRGPLTREMAWGCLTSNLALPGSGSLLAGRRIGYAQLALGFGGLIVTGVFGLRLLVWFVANWRWLMDPEVEFGPKWSNMWPLMLWPVAGMAMFGLGLIWALVTSCSIVQTAKPAEPTKPPAEVR